MATVAASFGSQTYSPTEEAEMRHWLAVAERLRAAATADGPAARELLDNLNAHLASRTTLLGHKPSAADVAVYHALGSAIARWSPEERSGEAGHPHIVRLIDFVQGSPLFGLALDPAQRVAIDCDDVRYVKPVVDVKAEKERLKKEKAATAATAAADVKADVVASTGLVTSLPDRTKEKASTGAAAAPATKPKREPKEKVPKASKAPPPAAPLSPALIDLRVGLILKAVNHPDADSLYVSTIAMGDAPGGDDMIELEGHVCRTVCSGLNGLVPLAEMQGRKVVVVCNLKPVKMRGIKSSAMVLAASPRLKPGEEDAHAGPVELVSPPSNAEPGERVFFQGWKGDPEGQLNPKKKVWETIQPGFTTTDALEVAFNAAAVEQLADNGLGKLVTASGGVCTVKSLKDAVVR